MTKNENIINIYKKYKNDFFKNDKTYNTKKLLTQKELIFFEYINEIYGKDYWIFPQVSLRAIIQTPNYNQSSKELYRTIDIVMFYANYEPMLAIELNGKEHKTNKYTKIRDFSNKQICKACNLPLLTIWTDTYIKKEEIKKLIDTEIKKIENDNGEQTWKTLYSK